MKALGPQEVRELEATGKLLHLEDALSLEEVRQLRARVIELLEVSEEGVVQGQLYPHRILASGLAYDVLGKSGLLRRIQGLFQTRPIILPDLNVHINQFGNSHRNSGWHRDCDNEIQRRSRHPFAENYRLWKLGVYLQKNHQSVGGGINLVPDSFKHVVGPKLPAQNSVSLRSAKATLQGHSARLRQRGRFVPTDEGDALLFDSRILHQSTPKTSLAGWRQDKIVFYANVTDNMVSALNYLSNTILRAAQQGTRLHREAVSLSREFPAVRELVSGGECTFLAPSVTELGT